MSLKFEDIGNGRAYNADCFEVMKEISDGSVDMILADLPYGTTACKWDTIIPFEKMWAEFHRISKNNAAMAFTASQPFTSSLGVSNIKNLKYSWVWEKARPTDFLQAKRKPLKGFEDVLIFYRSPPIYNPQGVTSIERTVKNTGTKSRGRDGKRENLDQTFHQAVTGADENDCYKQTLTGYPRGIIKFAQDSGFHPTQKPVALCEYLIKTYTNEGDLVFDPTAGSLTTAVAAENTNRKWIVSEQLEEYFTKGIARLDK